MSASSSIKVDVPSTTFFPFSALVISEVEDFLVCPIAKDIRLNIRLTIIDIANNINILIKAVPLPKKTRIVRTMRSQFGNITIISFYMY